MIKRLFTPPHFENDDDNLRARFINVTAWLIILALAFGLTPQVFNRTPDLTVVVLPSMIASMSLALYIMHRKALWLSGFLVVISTWLGVTIQAYSAEGIKDVIVLAYMAVCLLTSIIISGRSGFFVILASIATLWILALAQENGWISPSVQPPLRYAFDLTLIFAIFGALIYASTTSLRDAVRRASSSEERLLTSNKELQQLNQTLEQRVSSRTSELEQANQRNEKRAQQFEAIAQVARATASAMETEDLLPMLVDVISQQFGFYHAGIFLIDESREYAILRAANSEGGKRMLQRGHRLAFGQTGIVGFVAATGTARIALDVGADAAFFNNPDLPNTRSEMALPLRSGHEIIGILDVQSTQPNAFQSEDVDVLSTLADQVTIAIQNARSYETTQQLLREAQKTSGAYLQESWKVLQSQETFTGYMALGSTIKRLSQPLSSPQINKALASGQTIMESGESKVLAVPVRLREGVVGVMNIRLPQDHDLDPDEIDIAEAIAERLSLAIETAVLLKTTQRRAEIERVTSEISGKIGSSTQFEAILRTAAEELSHALGGSEVLVQIQSTLQPETDGMPQHSEAKMHS